MHTVAGSATAAASELVSLKRISRSWEKDGTGSQGQQRTVVLEEKEKEENRKKISSVGQAAFRILWTQRFITIFTTTCLS
jgi:hypothetical protein